MREEERKGGEDRGGIRERRVIGKGKEESQEEGERGTGSTL